MKQENLIKNLLVVSIFAIAMGFLEAIVVVYVRELYYPDGFGFPLKLIPEKIFAIELVRELTTLVMLVSIGILVGRTRLQKFAWFLLAFGVWDIFYYVALKIFLDWPESLLTWDILFLLPVTWIGPVLAPVIASVTMIGFALAVFIPDKPRLRIKPASWMAIVGGAFLIFLSFILDYTRLLFKASGTFRFLEPGFIETITNYVPNRFYWGLFSLGEIMILGGITLYVLEKKRIS
jgi:hypothetical protein